MSGVVILAERVGWRIVRNYGIGAALLGFAWLMRGNSDGDVESVLFLSVAFPSLASAVIWPAYGLAPLKTSMHLGICRASIVHFVLGACVLITLAGSAFVALVYGLVWSSWQASAVRHIGYAPVTAALGAAGVLGSGTLVIAAVWVIGVRLRWPVAVAVLVGLAAYASFQGAVSSAGSALTLLACLPLAVLVVLLARRLPG